MSWLFSWLPDAAWLMKPFEDKKRNESLLRVPGSRWVPDSESNFCMQPNCPRSHEAFNMLLNPRHHCRSCGLLKCSLCCPVVNGIRCCKQCLLPPCFLPVRFPVWMKRTRAASEINTAAAASSSSATSPTSPAAGENPYERINQKIVGAAPGYFKVGPFTGEVVSTIFSFLETKELNALLQTCKRLQSHFHVPGLRYEAAVQSRFPTFFEQAHIGSGGQGACFRVRDAFAPADATNSFVIVKLVRKNVQYGYAVWQRLHTEIEIQKEMGGHPSIANLIDVFQTPDETVLVLEAGGGTVRKVFDALRSSRTEVQALTASTLLQTAAALQHMKENNITHRDYKPDNIVLSDDYSKVLTIDFGLAEKVRSDTQAFTPCGTVGFASPENIEAVVFKKGGKFQADIDTMSKADVFSLGVVAYMMLSSRKPFVSSKFKDMHRELQSNNPAGLKCDGRGWSQVPLQAKILVEKMLRADPNIRASPRDIMDDPWVNEGARKFADVVTRRRAELEKEREEIESTWDMPTIVARPRAATRIHNPGDETADQHQLQQQQNDDDDQEQLDGDDDV